MNIAVVTNSIPATGVPLPFISYGGSSLVACLTATGLIISVAQDAAYPDYPAKILELIRNKWQKLPFHRSGTANEGK